MEHSKSDSPDIRKTSDALNYVGDRLSKLQSVGHFDDPSATETVGSILLYSFKEADQVTIFLKSRKLQKWIGHILLQETDTNHYEILEVILDEELRGKGIGASLYKKIAGLGYHLQSNKVLSTAAEKVWLRLGAENLAKTLDLETGKVEPFNDKPVRDKNPMDIRFVWVLEQQDLGIDSYPMYEHWKGMNVLQEEIDKFEKNEWVWREWGIFIY